MDKQLQLTPRLQATAQMVPQGARLVDVGTDHAYLPTALLLEGRIPFAIAADVREGPLSRARATAQEYGCSDRVDLRLCDGLSGIRREEVDAVVIAGMGGETIAHILSAVDWIKDDSLTLILQPMSTQAELRRWLWQNGFSISWEKTVMEGELLYTLLNVRYGDAVPLDLVEEHAGRQWQGMDDPLRGLMLDRLVKKTERALEGLSQASSDRGLYRRRGSEQLLQGLIQKKEEWDAWQQ